VAAHALYQWFVDCKVSGFDGARTIPARKRTAEDRGLYEHKPTTVKYISGLLQLTDVGLV
jgi:hypothetical protein